MPGIRNVFKKIYENIVPNNELKIMRVLSYT